MDKTRPFGLLGNVTNGGRMFMSFGGQESARFHLPFTESLNWVLLKMSVFMAKNRAKFWGNEAVSLAICKRKFS